MSDKVKKINYFVICLFIFLTPVVPYNMTVHKNITVSDCLLLAIFALFFIEISYNKEKFKECFYIMLGDKTLFCLVLLLLVMAISISYAMMDKKLAFQETLRFFSYIVLYIILALNYKEKKYFKGFANSFVASVFVVSVIGVVQKVTEIGIRHIYDYKVNGVTMVRISSTLGNPNTLAALMILGIFPIAMMAFFEKNLKNKTFYGVLIVLVIYNMILTD